METILRTDGMSQEVPTNRNMLDMRADLRVRENTTLREKTADVFREAILSGVFFPGQRLVERDLCEVAQVSRTSVREALRLLESEGLIESRGTKGIFVAQLTHRTAMEIYDVRAALEANSAYHLAINATSEQIAQLEGVLRVAKRTVRNDANAYRHATDQFFELLVEGAGNSIAQKLMQTLRARISYLRARTTQLSSPERLDMSIQRLESLLDVIRAHDPDAAAAQCREIIRQSAAFAAEVIEMTMGVEGDKTIA